MIRKGIVAIIASIAMAQGVNATTYHAASFNDIVTNAAKLVAGDSLIIAAGTYNAPKADSTCSIRLKQSGVKGNRIFMGTVGSDRATLDFGFSYKASNYQSTAQGICVYGNYWYIKGLTITHAGDNGMLIETTSPYPSSAPTNPGGSYNIIDCCTFVENNDAGLQLKNFASYDTIINCDSYHNYDLDDEGGDADGFAPKQNCGYGLYFFGCRSWVNADDGWDAYYKQDKIQYSNKVTTVVDYCICYKNGYEKDEKTTNGNMNGNGFKMGSKEVAENFVCLHSISVLNKAKGFDSNNNTGDMKMFNCSAAQNGADDFALKTGESTIQNCVAMDGVPKGTTVSNNLQGVSGDFVSYTVTDLIAARNADGSLSDKTLSFMAPKSGDTKYVDKGAAVSGYNVHAVGTPDIGWIEKGYSNGKWDYTTKVSYSPKTSIKAKSFLNSISNSERNVVKVNYTTFSNGKLTVTLYDVSGKKVMDFGSSSILAGTHTHDIDMSKLNSGNYICELQFAGSDGVISGNAKLTKY